jgi:hypothetical protein
MVLQVQLELKAQSVLLVQLVRKVILVQQEVRAFKVIKVFKEMSDLLAHKAIQLQVLQVLLVLHQQ